MLLSHSGDSTFVYIIKGSDKKKTYERKQVTTGLSDGVNIEIKKGQIWGTVYMYVPGAYDVKFKKQGTDAYVWHQNTFDYYGDV